MQIKKRRNLFISVKPYQILKKTQTHEERVKIMYITWNISNSKF